MLFKKISLQEYEFLFPINYFTLKMQIDFATLTKSILVLFDEIPVTYEKVLRNGGAVAILWIDSYYMEIYLA